MLQGRVHILGDNISADYIISAKHLSKVSGIDELIPYVLEDVTSDFYKRIQPNDIILAGENFGSGSSREHAALVIKQMKISCVVAKSFGRNFYRNGINLGLPLIEAKWKDINDLDILKIDMQGGQLFNLRQNTSIPFNPLPAIMEEILKAGGMIPYFQTHKGFSI